MKEISISLLLKNMNQENNYEDDLWKTCLDEKGKRYRRKDISNSLKKLEALGFIKKMRISGTDIYYNKLSYSNPDGYVGFINNIMFTNESKIKESLKKLESRKIFVDISKDLNSYKPAEQSKENYEKLLEAFSNLTELASAIQLVNETSKDEELKKKLKMCHSEIKETLEKTNEKIIRDRKSNEIIVIQRRFAGRIPNPGFLKL
ncbi:hypothetical protein [Nitrosopumilus ureiphilus]|uniref:Uncharacterized protein n=1 Tax=Nitrosopumilus ureiphilus TaxID=1470067 RepID=A0A7D5M7Q7_9ARCH|nr:hypothetical protein [Nitrosopumilus ureiphilus]QLH06530.1 hypothetical protein C5F50_05165 [Nitrosopumilus ureiphilus]